MVPPFQAFMAREDLDHRTQGYYLAAFHGVPRR